MVALPLVGALSTRGVVKTLHRNEHKREVAKVQADIAVARLNGKKDDSFLDHANEAASRDRVEPWVVGELVERYTRGYNPALLQDALVVLSKTRSAPFPQKVLGHLDLQYNTRGSWARELNASRLLHPSAR